MYSNLSSDTTQYTVIPNEYGITNSDHNYLGIDNCIITDLISDNSAGVQSGNCCGFIAAGLLLLWYRTYEHSPELIDSFTYLHFSEKGFLNPNFTRKLLTFGRGNLSSADGILGYSSIKGVLRQYALSINAEINTTVTYFPSYDSIITQLKTTKKPIILFGDLANTNNPSSTGPFYHAVLAYGYTADNKIVVHFGGAGRTHTEIATTDSLHQSLYIDSYTINEMTFSDIPANSWAYDSVAYCTRYGIIDEQSGSSFAPTLPMDRGTFVNALYSIAGCPEVSQDDIDDLCTTFSDIDSNHKYIDAFAWTYKNAILTGMTATTIAPGLTVTRAQAVTFLYRYNNAIGTYEYPVVNGPSVYSFDDYELCNYSTTAMNWATRRYIIQGIGNNLIDPLSDMTRAQCAQMIYNFSLKANNYGEDVFDD